MRIEDVPFNVAVIATRNASQKCSNKSFDI